MKRLKNLEISMVMTMERKKGRVAFFDFESGLLNFDF